MPIDTSTISGRARANAWSREWRKRPDVHARHLEANARYRAENLERVRARDREYSRQYRARKRAELTTVT